MPDPQPHTPTATQIREDYAHSRYHFADGWSIGEERVQFDNWLTAEIAAAEQRGAIKALRDAANLSRGCWVANKNLRDPDDPEVSYSFDRWLEVRADLLEGDNEAR